MLSIPHYDNRRSVKKGGIFWKPGCKLTVDDLAMKALSIHLIKVAFLTWHYKIHYGEQLMHQVFL